MCIHGFSWDANVLLSNALLTTVTTVYYSAPRNRVNVARKQSIVDNKPGPLVADLLIQPLTDDCSTYIALGILPAEFRLAPLPNIQFEKSYH